MSDEYDVMGWGQEEPVRKYNRVSLLEDSAEWPASVTVVPADALRGHGV